jgi:predicted transcriptional regulator
MIPESKLIKKEVVLRELLLSKEVLETKNSLLRWIALSLGLINQNESRLGVLSVFEALVYFQFVEKKDANFDEIMSYLQKNQQEQKLSEKSVRYHLLQLKKKGIVENKKGLWYFSGSNKYDFNSWVEEYLSSFSNAIAPNIKTAFSNLITKLK